MGRKRTSHFFPSTEEHGPAFLRRYGGVGPEALQRANINAKQMCAQLVHVLSDAVHAGIDEGGQAIWEELMRQSDHFPGDDARRTMGNLFKNMVMEQEYVEDMVMEGSQTNVARLVLQVARASMQMPAMIRFVPLQLIQTGCEQAHLALFDLADLAHELHVGDDE